jgi:hypothetical protein
MVNLVHRSVSLLVLAIAPLLLCQCKTQRTVLGTRSSSVSFAGGEKTGDTKEIQKKWADKGYKIGEDGKINADNSDLYAGDSVRGVNKEFGKKAAKFKNSKARTKQFRTPEYIKRQEFNGVTNARESDSEARESNTANMAGKKLFGSKTKATGDMSAYGTRRFDDSNKVFSASQNAAVNTALGNAPNATGSPMQMGYRDNSAMSFDDVKKMLNPSSYARNTGLTE